MKPLLPIALFALLLPGGLLSAEIRQSGGSVILSGNNYDVELNQTDGTIRSIRSGGRSLTFDNSREGLWKIKFLDQSTLSAKQAGRATMQLRKEQVTFSFRHELAAVSVTVTPHDDFIDFQAEITPGKQPAIALSAPGRLNFRPEAVKGVVCHIKGATNPGSILRSAFFSPGARSGENSYWKQAQAQHSRPVESLFKGAFRNLGDKSNPRQLTVGDDASRFLDEAELEQLRALRITPTRPFGAGQAEIALLTDQGNVVAGGSRFGGRGAFIRWGAFNPPAGVERTIMELNLSMIDKLLREEKLEPGRHRVALIALNGELWARPPLSAWQQELRKRKMKVDLITGAEELARALRSPETAAILNPYTEHGIALPGKSLPESMEQIRQFVRAGGYWFESHGYCFYYEAKPVEWLSSGLQGAPSSFADFFHFDIAGKQAALYAVQPIDWEPFAARKDRSAIFLPSLYEIGGEPEGGYLDRAFVIYTKPGETIQTPVSRLRFGDDALESLRCFAKDNGISRKLEEKGSPELIEKTRNSVLWHPESWRLSLAPGVREVLPLLPVPSIVHSSSYLKGGFDKEYPDHLPPNRHFGTLGEFRSLVDEIRSRGMLFMPYTNNSWWCDHPRGPTFLAAGEAPLQRKLDGQTIHEQYANNDGWAITVWHPAVRAANEKLVREFTETIPSDILFQDQIGVRGGVSSMDRGAIRGYDLNPAAPTPYAVVEGFLSQARSDAEKVPLGTEEGWWGLIDSEFMMCGFSGGLCHFMAWQGDFLNRWPRNTWNLFPLVEGIAHDKTFMGHHDLAGDVRSDELLSWTLALGYNMVSRVDPRDPAKRQWLLWLDRIQKSVCSRYVAGGVSAFSHEWGANGDTGVIRAVYGPISVVANLRREPLREGDFTIAPHGFFASGGGVTAGDLASCAQGSAPGSFVVEKERAWLFAVPGAEVSFPVKPLPAAIRWEGGDVPFRKNGETISLRLPAGEENYPRLWELELVR